MASVSPSPDRGPRDDSRDRSPDKNGTADDLPPAERSPSPRRDSPPLKDDSPDRVRDRSLSREERRRSPEGRRERSRSREYRRSRSRSPRRRRSPSRDRYRRRSRTPPRGGDYGRRSPPRRPMSPYRRRGRTPPSRGLHMFVAGLNFIINEKELERKFDRFGKVVEARIVRNPRSGESRGFGFVVMDREEDVDDAIRGLDGREWNGRRLLVERAKNVK